VSRAALIGIDVGGTFTDAVVFLPDTGQVVEAFKLPSTPTDPANAVLAALERIARSVPLANASVCHGTTVGTNALLERKGAHLALLATEGFTDVIELRRQDRPTLYDLDVRISEPLVAPEARLPVRERLDAGGRIITALEHTDALVDALRGLKPEAIAVSLLHAYANDAHERLLVERLRASFPDAFLSISSDVCPEVGEYERTSTTVVNAYIGPPVSRYLNRLTGDTAALGISRLLIVKSNGGLSAARNASRYPVHLIESGPAAGMIAAAAFARAIKRPNLITFDMGGTTAKAGLIRNGEVQVSGEFRADAVHDGHPVGGYPIRSAVIELVEIGAGGGSLAWIDAGGVLKVGPQSAGADPGPACYGRGGTRPTVTDAHAVIGTLSESDFIGTGVVFSRDKAVAAVMQHVAQPMGWSLARAAYGIISIAAASMTEMVRLVTVRKGLDPREFSLLASGGAGPLHAAWVGREVGVAEIIVPPYPGMFSAIGATLGNIRHDLSQALLAPLSTLTAAHLHTAFSALTARARQLLDTEGAQKLPVRMKRHAELRFVGQLFELRVDLDDAASPLPSLDDIDAAFRQAYRREFAIELPHATVQLVRLGLVAEADLASPARHLFQPLGQPDAVTATAIDHRTVLAEDGSMLTVPVFGASDHPLIQTRGPALFIQAGATVWIPDGMAAQRGPDGCLVIRAQASITQASEAVAGPGTQEPMP
jgi:N-methylhydantoinase A